MTNSVIKHESQLYTALTEVEKQIQSVMPKNWDEEDLKRLLSCAALQSRRWGRSEEDRLEILANLDMGSFVEAVTTAASCNIIPDGRRGYLITRRGKAANFGKGGYTVTFQADYKGLIDVAKRSDPRIENIHADTIHMNDDFVHVEGSERKFTHAIPKETLATGRGEVIAAYAIAYYEGGHYDAEVVPLAELKQIMACSSANYGPNRDWPLQMHRKAAIRRLCKRLPETPDLARLIDNENSVFDLSKASKDAVKAPATLEIDKLPEIKKNPTVEEPEEKPKSKVEKPKEKKKKKPDPRKEIADTVIRLFTEAQGKDIPLTMNLDDIGDMSFDELESLAENLSTTLESYDELPF